LLTLGAIAEFPHRWLDLVPFTHMQHAPGCPLRTAPGAWSLLIDTVLIGVGLAAFRRRDLLSA
jgi:ABC-2 type transport system permease protein